MRTYITALILATTLGLLSCGGGNDVASSGATAVSAAAPATTPDLIPTTTATAIPITATIEPKHNGQLDERTEVSPVAAQATIAPSISNGNTTRSVKIFNNSSQATGICIFQTNQGSRYLTSLVWMSSFVRPMGSSTSISWDESTYSFNWGMLDSVSPGYIFNSSQSVLAASMNSQNQINFDCVGNSCSLQSQTNGQAGSLIISEMSSIPLSKYAVGFGMSGSPALIMQASPNQTVSLIGTPTYWITASPLCGNGQGIVLDSATISTSTKLLFPAGVTSLTATLNSDGSWFISSGSSPFGN